MAGYGRRLEILDVKKLLHTQSDAENKLVGQLHWSKAENMQAAKGGHGTAPTTPVALARWMKFGETRPTSIYRTQATSAQDWLTSRRAGKWHALSMVNRQRSELAEE